MQKLNTRSNTFYDLLQKIEFDELERRTTAPKFILAILVFLCLGHTKTKETQTNSKLQALISEPQKFVSSF